MRLVGWLSDRIRFYSVCEPAIHRKRDALFGRMPFLDPEPIHAIERGPRRDVVDIQTSTGTFYAAGLATHNCYARPTHEYLGFSAGLDFETRILVKEDAPELLRKALSSPRWEPRVVALSGVTDAYQPVERKLRLTRRCLEVFAEFRNPVTIVTKSSLVARDVDLLGELASFGAASVNVSITSLDDALRRALEPRASSPRQRLAAMRSAGGRGGAGRRDVRARDPGAERRGDPGDPRRGGGRGRARGGFRDAAAPPRREGAVRRVARAPLTRSGRRA